MNKNLRTILLISLVFNLLCFGIVGGHFFRVFTPPHPSFHSVSKDLKRILPKEKVQIFEASLQRHFKKRRDGFSKIENIHTKIEQIMTAPEFNKEAFRVQLKALNMFHASMFEGMGHSLFELLPTLTFEERQLFAEHLKKNRPPMRPRMMRPHPPHLTAEQKKCLSRGGFED